MMQKYHLTFCFFAIVVLVAIVGAVCASNYTSFISVYDACVNPETGDVALVYYEKDRIHLRAFDADGEPLFSVDIDSKGGHAACVRYEDNNLYIYVYTIDEERVYNREGLVLSVKEDAELWSFEDSKQFAGWDRHTGYRSYTMNGTTYRYETSSVFLKALIRKGRNQLKICKPDGAEVLIFDK